MTLTVVVLPSVCRNCGVTGFNMYCRECGVMYCAKTLDCAACDCEDEDEGDDE